MSEDKGEKKKKLVLEGRTGRNTSADRKNKMLKGTEVRYDTKSIIHKKIDKVDFIKIKIFCSLKNT